MATHSSILAFLLGKFHDRGAWQAIVHGVPKELDVTDDINTHKVITQTCKHTHMDIYILKHLVTHIHIFMHIHTHILI